MLDSRPDRFSGSSASDAEPVPQAIPSERSSPAPLPAAIERTADRVMDDLFGDVELMLERAIKLPEAAPAAAPDRALLDLAEAEASPEIGLSNPIADSALVLATRISPRPLALMQPEDSDLALADLSGQLDHPLGSQDLAAPTAPARSGWLLALGGLSLLLVGGGWWGYQAWQQRSAAPAAMVPATGSPSASDGSSSPSNQDFLSYIGRSLDRIQQTQKQQQETQALTQSPSPSPIASASPATVTERVYIPVYPPASAAPGGNSPNPPAVAARPSAAPASRSAPAVVPSSNAAPAAAGAIAAAPSPVAITHLLIGLLELGDRSAALFEIDGSPQRFQIGERIGSSGWTLVSISNQEAVVRRNGEVRSIYVGQGF